jgi:two-component system nitrogen regulation sensor histidine kinase NtrY
LTDASPGPRPDHRLSHDSRVFLLALLVGLPGVTVALALVWFGPFSDRLRWTVTAVLIPTWLALAASLREQVVRPLRTLANVLASFREGDFSIRARGSGARGSLALAYHELNALESILRDQRIEAVEASTLLQRVMGEIDVAVFAFDEEERLRLLNRAAERLLGRDEEKAVGCSAEDLRLESIVRGPAPRTVELSHPGGTGRWEVRHSIVRQEGQRLDLLVLSDLSRALREEEREAWKRLVRVLSHEINNSLAPIKSISASLRQMLARHPYPDGWEEDLSRGLDVIRGRADSLGRFMSSYARLAHLPPPELVPLQVEKWVRHVVGLETRLEVRLALGPSVSIEGDRDQLEQALINIVGNAVEAVDGTEGGVTVGWRLREGRLEVYVEDEGPGLPETANLFVPFYTTKPAGSGIGLVLSRQIVEGHGGTLTLENRADGGARAVLALPLRTASAESRPDAES